MDSEQAVGSIPEITFKYTLSENGSKEILHQKYKAPYVNPALTFEKYK